MLVKDSRSPPEIHFVFSCIPFVSALLKLIVFSLKIVIVFVKETTDLSCDFLQITSAVQKVYRKIFTHPPDSPTPR